MNQDSQKNKKKASFVPIGPCGEHNCPICIFTKSQAPGNPYDLKDCLKYNSRKGLRSTKRKQK
ncbi:MAG: hypothetical protein P9X22_04210 [Candidatus Zapsychrus exili]|nr:hypothetical protein [Candidatus Zapsychrus exili]